MSKNIWVIKIECVSGRYLEEPVSKICEIDSSFPLDYLCDFILNSFGFDNDHLYDFFISRHWQKRKNIIEDDSIVLEDIFPLEKKNFLFMLFDYGDDWVFRILRLRKKPEANLDVSYPRVVEHVGVNPEQYPCYEDE